MAANPVIEKRNLLLILGQSNPENLLVRVAISGEVQVSADDDSGQQHNVLLQPSDPNGGSRVYDLLEFVAISGWRNSSTLFKAVTNGWLFVDVPEGAPVVAPVIPTEDCCDLAVLKPPDQEIGDLLVYDGTNWVRLPTSPVVGRVLASNGTGFIPSYQAAGAGDVTGPGASTDNAVARWNGAGGTAIENSLVLIDDTGVQTLPASLIFVGIGAPSLSAASRSKQYFDSGSFRQRLSMNGGAYSDVITRADVFSNVVAGVVPASGGGVVNFLRADGTWTNVGMVTGTGVNNQVAVWSAAAALDGTATFTFDSATATLSVDGPAIFNDSGANKDFRVEAVGKPNALFIRGSDGFIGINTAAPVADMEINRNVNANVDFAVTNPNGGGAAFSRLFVGENYGANKYGEVAYLGTAFTPLGLRLSGQLMLQSAVSSPGGILLAALGASAPIVFSIAGVAATDERLRLGLAESVFNEGASNIDLRAEGSGTRPNLFLVDAGLARVGINRAANTHGATLDIDNLAVAESVFIARDNGTAVFTIADKGLLTRAPSAALAAGEHADTLTATLPANAATQIGVLWTITTTGAGAGAQHGLALVLAGGYTGTTVTAGLNIENAAAGTGTWNPATQTPVGSAPGPNAGAWLRSDGSTAGTNAAAVGVATLGGINVGSYGAAGDSSAADNGYRINSTNYGVVGSAALTKNVGSATEKHIGVMGLALAGDTNVGGYFGLQVSTPTFATAALIADNGAVAASIFVARDNGTAVFTIIDGGHLRAIDGTGALPVYGYTAQSGTGAWRTGADSNAWSSSGNQTGELTPAGSFQTARTATTTAATPTFSNAFDPNTGLYFPAGDNIGVTTGGVERAVWGTSLATFNDPGNDYDLRIEGVGQTHLVFLDASVAAIGIRNATPVSVLDVDGSFGLDVTSTSSTPFTLDITHHTLLVDATGGDKVVNLPAVAGVTRRRYEVVKTDSSANTVTVDGNSGDLINGVTTYVLINQYDSVTVVCDGSAWYTV